MIFTMVWVPYIFTSFSNLKNATRNFLMFEYHTFLHHSQTITCAGRRWTSLSTIHFYIILKLLQHSTPCIAVWVPYIFTSFSNRNWEHHWATIVWVPYIFTSFSNERTIQYIGSPVWVPYIFTSFSNWLRMELSVQGVWVPYIFTSFSNYAEGAACKGLCLSTIHFYIILKRFLSAFRLLLVWVPYIFTSFSNSEKTGHASKPVWVPYIFTSFSNTFWIMQCILMFEYHTFLHHSQTRL